MAEDSVEAWMPVRPTSSGADRWNAASVDEIWWWPRVLWIDAGKVSGVACVWFDPKALLEGASMPRVVLARATGYLYGDENRQANAFLNAARYLARDPEMVAGDGDGSGSGSGGERGLGRGVPWGETGLVVGAESFMVLRVASERSFLSSPRIASKVEFGAWSSRNPLQWQSPSGAIGAFPDTRLSKFGLHDPGPDHIRDALRHCLLWITRLRGSSQAEFAAHHGDESGWWADE